MLLDLVILKKIVNKNFTWGDLNPKYTNIEQLKTNTFCVFHQHNWTVGNAKFYYNEDEGYWVMYCFVEHKAYTAYDYLDLILCKQKQYYRSTVDFLRKKLGDAEFKRYYNAYKEADSELTENNFQRKINWINNVYDESEDIVDYIERLYTA